MMLQIFIPDSLAEALRKVQEQTKEDDITDVIKSALQLYAACVQHRAAGRNVTIREATGEEIPLFVDSE